MKKTSRIVDKQNEPTHKEKEILSNPINEKIQKFGKSIRARLSQKLQQPNRRASQPLQESSSFNMRQSEDLQSSKPLLEDISKMSVSYIGQFAEDSDGRSLLMGNSTINMSKLKSVRFMDIGQCSSASLSKSLSRKSSILKNSQSSDKLSSNSMTSHVGSIKGGLSIKASLKDKGVDCENKKYENTLKILMHQNKKFFDDMFPPGTASLFHTKTLINSRKDIRWMRIDDVYRGHKLVLYNPQAHKSIKIGQFAELNYMATSFNALGSSHRCLERIFQKQQYSRFGIYYLRLNHEGIWKYTIVDDFIPVKQVEKGYEPVFMTLEPTESNYIEVWPLILQKALAKMYSTYQCLFNDSVENMMQDLTGIARQQLSLSSEAAESNELKIKSLLLSKDNIIIATKHDSKNNTQPCQSLVALVEHQKKSSTYFTSETQLKPLSICKQKSTENVPLENLHLFYKNVHLYQVDDSHYSVGCVIKQQMGSFSLRVFKVAAYGRCVLSVIQKDKKYFRNNGYDYSWMRILLVCKDLEGYRYISGAYAKKKTVHIDCHLSPGQYFILVCGDWPKKVYDVTLNYQGSLQTEIRREPLSKYPNLIDQTCRDIAQRFGTFIQINKNVCSYQYCDRTNGLVIENFNNELDRQVYFHREYKIPFKNYVNLGKAVLVEDEYNKNKPNRKFAQCSIETFLEPDGNLTMALMTVGGINEQEFNQFKSL